MSSRRTFRFREALPLRGGDIPVPTLQRQECRCSLSALIPILLLPLAHAATLSIEPTGPETLNLHLAQDPDSYFYLQQATDLGHFTPFSMVLGETPNDWNLYTDPETPSRFFRSRAISLFAPEDTDGDGIDDLYELRHPVLNPLDPTDGVLDPDNNSQSYLQEYRTLYNFGDGKREALSTEVSVFTTRPFTGPTYEAMSEEVSIFTTRPFNGPVAEALSEEVSIFTTRLFTGPVHEAISDEVSLQKSIPPP